jgi:diaminopimelate epimerase
MQLTYTKMQGTGNQILIVDRRSASTIPPSADVLKRMGAAELGPGFDQLMWLGTSNDDSMAASYRVFNADGSEVEQCGNGVRCVALMLAHEDDSLREFVFESPVGPIEARVLDDKLVAVNMGPPVFDPARVPFVAEVQSDRYTLDVAGEPYDVAILSMGNPHCVLEVDDVATADVAGLGPLIESHHRFPARTNAGFVTLRDRANVDLRVYERGAGETLACGTGACAAVVAGHRQGRLDDTVAVELPGGELVVSWRGGSEPVWLTGNAEILSQGTIDL